MTMHKNAQSVLFTICILLFAATLSQAASASFTWTANSESLTGYKIYYGTSSRNYSYVLDVGLPKVNNGQTSASVDGLQEGQTYYFAATAYSTNGESDYSDEVKYTVPDSVASAPPVDNDSSATNSGTSTPTDPSANINDQILELGDLIATSLASNIRYYTDRTYTLYDVPPEYAGMTLIKTPNDERKVTMATGYIKFQSPDDTTVYVAYDRRASSLPDWMSDFTYTGENIYTSLASQGYLKIYSKAYKKGNYVNLGGNYAPGSSSENRSNYVVFYDLEETYGQTGTSTPIDSGCKLDANFQKTTIETGAHYYTDRNYMVTGGIPDWMAGRTLIKTGNDERFDASASGYLTFTNPTDGWVYVLFDSRTVSTPSWLSDWDRRSDLNLTTSLKSQPYLKFYRKKFNAGECVDLGGNYGPGASTENRSNYIVVYGQ